MQKHNSIRGYTNTQPYLTILVTLLSLVMGSCASNTTKSNAEGAFSDPTAPVSDSLRCIPSTVKPLIDVWMRDTYVMRGPDDYYYLTGTTASPGRVFPGRVHCWDYNDGLYLWRSRDLKHWDAMGRIWSFDKDGAAWQKKGTPIKSGSKSLNGDALDSMYRAVWAPELHYIKSQNKWLLAACLNGGKGSFVLESVSGKPQGPYRNIKANEDAAIFHNIDLGIFEDTDSAVYLVGHDHYIARMNKDLSGLAQPFRKLKETPYKKDPYIEGVWLDKHKGKYQLVQSIWSVKQGDGSYSYLRTDKDNNALYSYDVVVAEADSIYGPYGPRYTAIIGGGHNNFFKDKSDNWWSTVFFNPRGGMAASFPVTCRPAVLPLKWEGDRALPDPKAAARFYSTLK